MIAAILAWWVGTKVVGGGDGPAASGAATHRRTADELVRELRGRGEASWSPPGRLDGGVTIAGTVTDAGSGEGVEGVEVVFRNEDGEETTTTAAGGAYRIDLPLGTYRAFVRGATVVSVEPSGAPGAEEAMTLEVAADIDRDGIDLTVMRGGIVRGKVVDPTGRAIAKAVVRLRTDDPLCASLRINGIETGTDGAFEMRLPAGSYGFDVSHPEFAGTAGRGVEVTLASGDVQTTSFTLAAGCLIAGRIVRADGMPSDDGSIERRSDPRGLASFRSVGKFAADGTFSWRTTDQGEVVLRAWPWKAQPSETQSFDCREGARYEQVVFALPDRGPDLEGVLVDHTGAPVAGAYIDVYGRNPGLDQRERTDDRGRWSLFALPPSDYRISAHAPGRGIASLQVDAPGAGIRIQLGGIGRIEGTTDAIADGSFELELTSCGDGSPLSGERRNVVVTDGRFVVENVPACTLSVAATWSGHRTRAEVAVPSGGTGRLDLELNDDAVQLCVADGHR